MPLHEAVDKQLQILNPNPSPEQARIREKRRDVASKMQLLFYATVPLQPKRLFAPEPRTVNAWGIHPQTGAHTLAYITGVADRSEYRTWLILGTYEHRRFRAPELRKEIPAESKDNDLNFSWYRSAYDDEQNLSTTEQANRLEVVSHFVGLIGERAIREDLVAPEAVLTPGYPVVSQRYAQTAHVR